MATEPLHSKGLKKWWLFEWLFAYVLRLLCTPETCSERTYLTARRCRFARLYSFSVTEAAVKLSGAR